MISTLFKRLSDKKYLFLALIITLIVVIGKALKLHPFYSFESIGDEVFYYTESDYLEKYGFYKSLSQGTSVLFSIIILFFSKLFATSLLIGGRIYSVISFLTSTLLLYNILKKHTRLSLESVILILIYFATMCKGWLWLELADLAAMPFVFGSLYLLLQNNGYRNIVISSLLLFLGFAIKPTCFIMLPAFIAGLALMRYRINGLKTAAYSVLIYGSVFLFSFVLYHIPGYQIHGKLMLESKNHTYNGDKRVENKISWVERNVYLQKYNVNNKPNNWHITWEEVDSFKSLHPEINLNMSITEYVKENPANHLKKILKEQFLFLPYEIQSGFFFCKWNIVNHIIRNDTVIKLLTLLLLAGIYFKERETIKNNFVLLLLSITYFLSLSIYSLIDIQSNWLLWCFPFFAIPIVSFLTKYVNIALLVLLQLLFIVLI